MCVFFLFLFSLCDVCLYSCMKNQCSVLLYCEPFSQLTASVPANSELHAHFQSVHSVSLSVLYTIRACWMLCIALVWVLKIFFFSFFSMMCVVFLVYTILCVAVWESCTNVAKQRSKLSVLVSCRDSVEPSHCYGTDLLFLFNSIQQVILLLVRISLQRKK